MSDGTAIEINPSLDLKNLDPRQKAVLAHEGPGFDLRTEIKDPLTGVVLKRQPYRLVCEGANKYFIRDGKQYTEAGHLMSPPKVGVK